MASKRAEELYKKGQAKKRRGGKSDYWDEIGYLPRGRHRRSLFKEPGRAGYRGEDATERKADPYKRNR